jgi:hypothetical protein
LVRVIFPLIPLTSWGGVSAQRSSVERPIVSHLSVQSLAVTSISEPPTFWVDRFRAEIEALALRGQIDVTPVLEHDDKLAFPAQNLRAQIHNVPGGAVAFTEVPDVLGLLAFVLKDALVKRLDALIDDEANGQECLSHEDRQRRTAVLQGDLLDIERQEAEMTWSAMALGLAITARGDINPLALLQCRLITPPRAVASPETSSWGWDIVGR